MMKSSEKMLTSAILCKQKNFWVYFWKEDRLKIIPAKFRRIWINYKKIIKGGSNRPPPQPTHAQKSPTVVGLKDQLKLRPSMFTLINRVQLWPCEKQLKSIEFRRKKNIPTLSLTRKNICNLIGWEEYNIGRICTLFSIFVLFD